MKRIIYQPSGVESVPEGSVSVILATSGLAIDVIVEDYFVTSGKILYDSLTRVMLDESDLPVSHHFAGWEF